MVASRSGPTETMETGHADLASKEARCSHARPGAGRTTCGLRGGLPSSRAGSRRRAARGQIVEVAGEVVDAVPVAILVGDGDLDGLDTGEDVEQHDGDLGGAADARRVADGDGVEPAAAAGTAGDGAELVALLADLVARGVVLLGRERAAADAGRVGLDDAEPAVDCAGGHAGAGREAAGARVGAGDVRVAAVVDVEQRALGAFEEEAAALSKWRRAARPWCRGRRGGAVRRGRGTGRRSPRRRTG